MCVYLAICILSVFTKKHTTSMFQFITGHLIKTNRESFITYMCCLITFCSKCYSLNVVKVLIFNYFTLDIEVKHGFKNYLHVQY